MRRLYCGMIVMLCIAMSGTIAQAATQPVSDELKMRVEQDLESIEGDGLMPIMHNLRESGASYLPEITAPTDVDGYQDPKKQMAMIGVYLTNMAYAAAFEQPRQGAEYGQGMFRLLEALGFPWPEMERRFLEVLENVNEPGGEERVLDLLAEMDADTQWQELLDTDAGMAMVVSAFYGSLVECIYLSVEIAVLSGYPPAFLQFVNNEYQGLLVVYDLLILLDDQQELSDLLDTDARMAFIVNLIDVVGNAGIGPDQVDALRPMITRERNTLVH